MRGAGDHLSIGERVAFYRVRRGLTQAVLANLVNRSEDWLSKIERGERQIRRLDVLGELATALRVSLSDLLGQPVLLEDDHQHDDVPAVRDALMAPRRLSRILFAGDGATWQPDVDEQVRRPARAHEAGPAESHSLTSTTRPEATAASTMASIAFAGTNKRPQMRTAGNLSARIAR